MGYFMTNIYLDRIAGLQKVAVDIGTLQHLVTSIDPAAVGAWALGGAGHVLKVHAFQNALAKAALHTPIYQASAANHFAAGMQNRMSPTNAGSHTSIGTNALTVGLGGVNSELNIMRDEFYHMGHSMRHNLSKAGIDPDNMPRKVKVALSRAARGDFTHLKKHYENDTLVMRSLEAAGKATGHPFTDIVRSDSSTINDVEKAWKDNVISNKFGTAISQRRDMSHLPVGQSSPGTGKSLIGASAMGYLTGDAVLVAMNGGKAIMADRNIVQKSKLLSDVSDKVKAKLVASPIKTQFKKGTQGVPYNNFRYSTSMALTSAPVTELKSLSNNIGMALGNAKKGPVTGPAISTTTGRATGPATMPATSLTSSPATGRDASTTAGPATEAVNEVLTRKNHSASRWTNNAIPILAGTTLGGAAAAY